MNPEYEAEAHRLIDLHMQDLLLDLYVAKPSDIDHGVWAEHMESYLAIYVADEYSQYAGKMEE